MQASVSIQNEREKSCDLVICSQYIFWSSSPNPNFLRAMEASSVGTRAFCLQVLKLIQGKGEMGAHEEPLSTTPGFMLMRLSETL